MYEIRWYCIYKCCLYSLMTQTKTVVCMCNDRVLPLCSVTLNAWESSVGQFSCQKEKWGLFSLAPMFGWLNWAHVAVNAVTGSQSRLPWLPSYAWEPDQERVEAGPWKVVNSETIEYQHGSNNKWWLFHVRNTVHKAPTLYQYGSLYPLMANPYEDRRCR